VRVADRREQMIHRLDRWTAHWSDLHICVSSGVRDFTARSLRIPDDKLRVIPNGVVPPVPEEPAVDLGQRLGIISKGGIATLLFVGRLDPQKGLEDLLSALTELNADQTLRQRLRVICVGSGPLDTKLREQTQALGLGEVVHWAGWQADAVSWMQAADGLVLPSHWEGMPNVVLEAMAAGCPVIATAVEGTREVLEEGKTGWLVPPGRPELLASAIERFLDSPDLRRQLGQNGREVVRTKFTIDRMVAAYEACYMELLGQGR
jgi:glycosyltransferase involved in cell wall biosynthesis